jgi:hypothetical protein
MPPRLLHSRAGLRQIFKAALDLPAAHTEIRELSVVEPVQHGARSLPLVARDRRRGQAVDETAQVRQPNRSSQDKWPGGGSLHKGQHRHGYVLRSRNPMGLPAHPFYRRPVASIVSAGFGERA